MGRESHLCHSVCMEGRSNLQESVPSFHQVSPRHELRWSGLAASASEPPQHPSFHILKRLLGNVNVWVQLSLYFTWMAKIWTSGLSPTL